MSLKLIKLLQLVLLVCLLFSLYQGSTLGYRLLIKDAAVDTVDFNLKEIEKELANISVEESNHQFVVRKNNWQQIETDKLFPIKKQVKHKTKKQKVQPQTTKNFKAEEPFVLVATSVFTEQGVNKAVVAAKDGEETYIVQAGQKINGYQITEIKANKLLLEINGRSITLNLGGDKER
ncbi:hypothetical protein [Sporohalobacter salinus]|uniref:hypothetical protein n=1 Tax=Sporohalobacter salinus TaxID=1494606 RepID=UPI001961A186|nr:hypothetical protein [Sporohalobacter salinus]MBM7623780.1 hypothetical protein [Sporohalobacter salinus]